MLCHRDSMTSSVAIPDMLDQFFSVVTGFSMLYSNGQQNKEWY